MTNYLFTPSDTTPYQFQPTLDNVVYTVTVPYNYFEQRYYIQIATTAQTLVYYMPLIGSPPNFDISLLPPMNPLTSVPWVSTMVFRASTQNFEVNP